MKVWIMRGIPGAGKTTWARENVPIVGPDVWNETVVCSADDYQVNLQGKYEFRPERAGEAHAKCKRKFLDAVLHTKSEGSNDTVVVDNTNTTTAELGFYVGVCEALEVDYEIVTVECDPCVAARRNVHGVPPRRVLQMHCQLREAVLPPWWRERVVLAEVE